jgi:hypothetical protein
MRIRSTWLWTDYAAWGGLVVWVASLIAEFWR